MRGALIAAAMMAMAARSQPADLTAEIESIRKSYDLPSVAAAAYRDGELIGAGASGWYSSEHATPVTTASRYHLGSCTKAMTAVVVASVIEQTDLDWSTTLPDALPELRAFINTAYATVTVRDLLAHRSGLVERYDQALLPLMWTLTQDLADQPVTAVRLELAKTSLSAAPAVAPHSAFEYSNYGYVVAAVIAETWGGMPWEELIRERVFAPLGMNSAGFGPPGAPGEVFEPLGHIRQDELVPMDIVAGQPLPDNPEVLNPAGRVHASVVEWGRFVDDFQLGLDGQGKLLTPESYRILGEDAEKDGYALGWGISERDWAGGTAYVHAGSNRFWYCVAWIAPEKNLSLVVAVNAAVPGTQQAADEAIAAMVERFTFTPEQTESASTPPPPGR
jgi:CubicO group peptidase (beta-lactamase class C family)